METQRLLTHHPLRSLLRSPIFELSLDVRHGFSRTADAGAAVPFRRAGFQTARDTSRRVVDNELGPRPYFVRLSSFATLLLRSRSSA